MKKLILVLFLFGILVSNSFAAWTITPSIKDIKGNYVYLKLHCISDGSVSGSVNFVSLMRPKDYDSLVKLGATMMVMDVVPGVGAASPSATIDISFLNISGLTVFATTAVSNVANTTGINLSKDYLQYPVINTTMYISINDIGSAGDEVDVYIFCWVENIKA